MKQNNTLAELVRSRLGAITDVQEYKDAVRFTYQGTRYRVSQVGADLLVETIEGGFAKSSAQADRMEERLTNS